MRAERALCGPGNAISSSGLCAALALASISPASTRQHSGPAFEIGGEGQSRLGTKVWNAVWNKGILQPNQLLRKARSANSPQRRAIEFGMQRFIGVSAGVNVN